MYQNPKKMKETENFNETPDRDLFYDLEGEIFDFDFEDEERFEELEASFEVEASFIQDMLLVHELFGFYWVETNYDSALFLVGMALTQNPDEPSLNYKKAAVLFEMGKMEPALEAIEKALAGEEQVMSFGLKAKILVELGQRTNALSVLQEMYSKGHSDIVVDLWAGEWIGKLKESGDWDGEEFAPFQNDEHLLARHRWYQENIRN